MLFGHGRHQQAGLRARARLSLQDVGQRISNRRASGKAVALPAQQNLVVGRRAVVVNRNRERAACPADGQIVEQAVLKLDVVGYIGNVYVEEN